ncbi:MutS-related protein [Psychroserpens sp.]|nr:DNA mismatch repair protein MutS [Psychroserpens sp.]
MASGILIYLFWSNWIIVALIGVLGLIGFLFALSNYTDMKHRKAHHLALIDINEEELKINKGEYLERFSGTAFNEPKHEFSFDIDLFGKGSFFQYANRSVTAEGQNQLANLLTSNAITDIESRQNAIKELSESPKWMQNYLATASLIHAETPAPQIINWLKNHKPFVPKQMKWVPWVFSAISIILLLLAIFEVLDISFFGYWIFTGLGLTGRYLKQINFLAANSDKTKDTFKQYAALLLQIENASFESELLVSKQRKIQTNDKNASSIFKAFSKHLDALDNRNNLISAIFGNGYLLSDIKNAYKVEQWISSYASKVEDWFEVVSFFDAYISLGTYVFNHDDHVFPKLSKQTDIISAVELGHPLLDKEKRVNSDILIKDQQFFIVTGANMAGKSTFLRTISYHIMMANVGLPVCAKSSNYKPVKLITSMRTSDSLTDDSSYFFSELTRLKFIVDTIHREPYFIILDEILKGTNSTDKAIGSRKFVEKLVAGHATGIIATHDLSLCAIENELDDVKNYYFDAEIVDNELYFDYKLKKGICKNMNASFLLQKMNIV